MYQKIMVPLDGSRFAESALPLAVRLAQRSGAELHLVMIAEPSGPTAVDCEKYLDKVADRLAEDHDRTASKSVRAGNIVEMLLAEGDDSGADVTVLATHGRGGLSRAWLGSVATGFLHETDRPLILVRPGAKEASDPVVHWGFAKLLIPLDGTDLSEQVLAHATNFGELFDAEYHLTRVVIPPVDIGSPYVPPSVDVSAEIVETAKGSARDYLDRCAEPMRSRGLRVTVSVAVHAQAGAGILEVAEAEGCDSIAMATHGRTGLSRAFLGSAADKVLRGTRVPLLLYRPGTLGE
jgi:nucleotide-binding universal stress UspA family protein